MRRRWTWPILSKVANADDDTWVAAFFCWLVGGAVLLAFPAGLIDTTSVILIALVLWLGPLILGVAAIAGLWLWDVVDEYGRDLLPRRVREPVIEDLREVSRPAPPG